MIQLTPLLVLNDEAANPELSMSCIACEKASESSRLVLDPGLLMSPLSFSSAAAAKQTSKCQTASLVT
mgnify:FL=1